MSSRKSNVKSNVKQYSKLYDKASSMSDRADAKTREAKALYKKTGKNFVSRVINNLKSEQSAAVKKYQQTMNTAGKMTDEANTAWSAAKSAYKKTGKTYVTRIINNIKYS